MVPPDRFTHAFALRRLFQRRRNVSHTRQNKSYESPSVPIDVLRKLYMFVSLSVDGYFEGPNHDISWHNVDSEVKRFAIEMLR